MDEIGRVWWKNCISETGASGYIVSNQGRRIFPVLFYDSVAFSANGAISEVGRAVLDAAMGLSTNSAIADGSIASMVSAFNLANNTQIAPSALGNMIAALSLLSDASLQPSAAAVSLRSLLLDANPSLTTAASAAIAVIVELAQSAALDARTTNLISAGLEVTARGLITPQAYGNFVMALLIAGSPDLSAGAKMRTDGTLPLSANADLANAALREMVASLGLNVNSSLSATQATELLAALALSSGTEITASIIGEVFATLDLNCLAEIHSLRPSAVKAMFMSLLHLSSTIDFIMEQSSVTVGMETAETEITIIKEEDNEQV